MHRMLRNLYYMHVPTDYREPGPFEDFVTKVAEYSPESCPQPSVLRLTTLCAQLPIHESHSLKGHSKIIWSLAFSPDGKQIVSCSKDNTIRIWDFESGKVTGSPGTITAASLALSPDGSHIAFNNLGSVCIWDTRMSAQVRFLSQEHAGSIWTVAYSPDGERVASGSDNTIRGM
jgi:WD40 repeat protein